MTPEKTQNVDMRNVSSLQDSGVDYLQENKRLKARNLVLESTMENIKTHLHLLIAAHPTQVPAILIKNVEAIANSVTITQSGTGMHKRKRSTEDEEHVGRTTRSKTVKLNTDDDKMDDSREEIDISSNTHHHVIFPSVICRNPNFRGVKLANDKNPVKNDDESVPGKVGMTRKGNLVTQHKEMQTQTQVEELEKRREILTNERKKEIISKCKANGVIPSGAVFMKDEEERFARNYIINKIASTLDRRKELDGKLSSLEQDIKTQDMQRTFLIAQQQEQNLMPKLTPQVSTWKNDPAGQPQQQQLQIVKKNLSRARSEDWPEITEVVLINPLVFAGSPNTSSEKSKNGYGIGKRLPQKVIFFEDRIESIIRSCLDDHRGIAASSSSTLFHHPK